MLNLTSTGELNNLVSGFNWQNPSWDLFILLFWGVASLIYAFAAGRGRIISMLMSLYISKLLVLEAPWLSNAINSKLPSGLSAIQQLVSFLIVFILLFILLSRYAFPTAADGRRLRSIPFSVVFAFLQIGLLINIILNYLPDEMRQNFSSLVQFIFVSQTASFLWIIAPLIFIIFLGRAVSDKTEV